jgi:succinate dehydrogenase / fumarate reductase cytochrome b subunit
MAGLAEIWRSHVGKKLIAASTGMVLLFFLLGHMAGNLKALLGADGGGIPQIDAYAEFLRTVGEPVLPPGVLLWIARITLLVCLVLHVLVVSQLAVSNRGARPIGYAMRRTRASSWMAKSMMLTGVAILIFVVVHILHFTTGTVRFAAFEPGKVYANLYHSFRQPLVAIGYSAIMLLVGMHLWHGGWSFFQTWGWDRPDRNRVIRGLAIGLTLVIVVGFCALPISFVFGWLPEPSPLVP